MDAVANAQYGQVLETREFMKVMSLVATLNAGFAIVSALLGVAPFTPAIALFVLYAPLTALSAALGSTWSAMVAVASTVVAWLLSPIRFESPHPQPFFWLAAWVVGWSLLAVAPCVTRSRHWLWSSMGGPGGA